MLKHENQIAYWKAEVGRGRVGRREFLARLMALGVALPVATTLYQDASAAPQRGGHVTVGLGGGNTSDSLDPGTHTNTWTQVMVNGYSDYLTEIAADGSLQAELAESWEPSKGGSQWVFKLRRGVTFHNGREVTAEDVIASLNHHRGEDSQSAAKPIVSPIEDMKADGKYELVVTLEAGNADFPFLLTDYHIPILPANSDGSMDWQSKIGSGAYKLGNVDFGVRAEFERNDNYWKNDRGWFDSAELITVADTSSRMNAIISGEVDVVDKVDLRTVNLLKRNNALAVEEVSGTQHFTFPMHVDVAPFDDVNVRLALKWGINRQELVDKILNGYGTVGNDHPIGRGQRYFAKDLPQREYDADKARHYLKKAGLSELSVQLSAANAAFSNAVDAASLYAESARAAGINIEVVREPDDGYWSNVWTVKPFTACYWGGRVTEDFMFSTAYEEGVPWNDTHWANKRFNELLKQGRSETDDAKRRTIYAEMQQLCSDDGGTIVPMFASYVSARNKSKVTHGGTLGSAYSMDNQRILERWWRA